MKNLLLVVLITAAFTISAQSRYPLQTVFKGEEVVILTKNQADNINIVFEKQKQEILQLKNQFQRISNLNDSLDSIQKSYYNFYVEKLKKLELLENLIYWAAVDGTWIYYSYSDSIIKLVDLSFYYVDLNNKNANLLFINTPAEYRIHKVSEREESPPLQWEYRFPEAIRPRVYNFPN
jgi:hypothetical protein